MKRVGPILMLTLALLSRVASIATAADSPKKYALLVGVAKYQHAEMNKPLLEFPESDAKDLGALLKASGYDVDLLLGKDATQDAIRTKLAAVKKKGNSDGVVVIGLFGHGVEFAKTGDACFCPYDTGLREARDALGRVIPDDNGKPLVEPDPDSLVKMAELLSALRLSPAGNRVLLADCCRSSPNQARGRAFGANIKLTDLPENTAALFACSSNEQAFEHKDWGHGAFTKALLEELKSLSETGETKMGTIADRLRPKVQKLVAAVSSGRDHQTTRSLVTDVVDLQLSPSSPALPKTLTSKSSGMKLTLIPEGTFQMGSPVSETERSPDEAQHAVRISRPFYMGVYEVTQGEYQSVMGANPSKFSKTGTHSSDVSGMDTTKFPVETMSWYDAVEFCNKLSVQDGLPAYYTLTNVERDEGSIKSATVSVVSRAASAPGQSGYRLPTEAEWEYACRGNTTTPFHFGSVLNGDKANINGNYPYGTTTKGPFLKRTATVGSYPANAFGLYDMHGNVFEWCFDVYDKAAYAQRSGTTTDPLVTSGSEYRVLRGGSWNFVAMITRTADRVRDSPVNRSFNVGFRVVR
jgi:formylglycine-generating enzyme required for sulfatase activity